MEESFQSFFLCFVRLVCCSGRVLNLPQYFALAAEAAFFLKGVAPGRLGQPPLMPSIRFAVFAFSYQAISPTECPLFVDPLPVSFLIPFFFPSRLCALSFAISLFDDRDSVFTCPPPPECNCYPSPRILRIFLSGVVCFDPVFVRESLTLFFSFDIIPHF